MSSPSLAAIAALIIGIILIFAVVILYVIYFVNTDLTDEYGPEWDFVNVSNTEVSIAPRGRQVLSVDGGSSSRGENPDFLYVTKPKNIPYVKRTFIIYNSNTNSAQLELRGDGVNFGTTNNPFFIDAQTGVFFVWKNEDTILPIVQGAPINN